MPRLLGLPSLLLLALLAGCQFDSVGEDYAQSDNLAYRVLQRPDGSRQLETRIPVPFDEFFSSWTSNSFGDPVHPDSTPAGQTKGRWWRQNYIYDAQPWGDLEEFWFGWWLLDVYQIDRQNQTIPTPLVSQGVAQLYSAFETDAYKGYVFTKYWSPAYVSILNNDFGGTNQYLIFGFFVRPWTPSGDSLDTMIVAQAPAGTPAGNAGLRNGDRILTVNGHRATMEYLTDSVGTGRVPFVYLRPGVGLDTVDLARAAVTMPSVWADTLPGGIGYVSISGFDTGDSTAVPKVLSSDLQFQASASWLDSVTKPGKPWILDLIENGGGSIDVAQNIASSILPAGDSLVQLTERYIPDSSIYLEGQDTSYPLTESTVPPHLHGRSVLVLQDSGTASASELVISALRENLGSLIREFGGTTFGKGIGQNYFPTPLGGYMAVTSLHINPIHGKPSYHHIGIPADVAAPSDSAAVVLAWKYAVSGPGSARALTAGLRPSPGFLAWNRLQAKRPTPPELRRKNPLQRGPSF